MLAAQVVRDRTCEDPADCLLVIHQYIGTFYVSMKKIFSVTIVETVEKLLHYTGVVQLVEVDHTGLKQTH